MVRTRADAGATKVSAAKAPRKVFNGGAGSSSGGPSTPGRTPGKDKYSGGNAYNPQPTPEWQKGIYSFFKAVPKPESSKQCDADAAESSTAEELASPLSSTVDEEPASSSSSTFNKNGIIDDDDDE